MTEQQLPQLPEPSLSKLNELAKVYASSYASPHHITFTVDGLRSLMLAAVAAERERVAALPSGRDGERARMWFAEWEQILPSDARESFRKEMLPSAAPAAMGAPEEGEPTTCCEGQKTCSHACAWGRGWDAAMSQNAAAQAQGTLPRVNSVNSGLAYVVEYGAISLPFGDPSRLTCLEIYDKVADAAAAAEASEFNAHVFAITIPHPQEPQP